MMFLSRRTLGLHVLITVAVMLAGGIGQAVPIPNWLEDRLIASLEENFPGTDVSASGFSMSLDLASRKPNLVIDRISLDHHESGAEVNLFGASMIIDSGALVRGRIDIHEIAIDALELSAELPESVSGQVPGLPGLSGPAIGAKAIETLIAESTGSLSNLVIDTLVVAFGSPSWNDDFLLEGTLSLNLAEDRWQGEIDADLTGSGGFQAGFSMHVEHEPGRGFPDLRVRVTTDTHHLGILAGRDAGMPVMEVDAELGLIWLDDGTPGGIHLLAGLTGTAPDAEGSGLAFQDVSIDADYMLDSEALHVTRLDVVTNQFSMTASGEMILEPQPGKPGRTLESSLKVESLSVLPGMYLDDGLKGASGLLLLGLDPTDFRVNHASMQVKVSDVNVSFVYRNPVHDGFDILSFNVDELDTEKLLAWWPGVIFSNTRKWLMQSLIHGYVREISGEFILPLDAPVEGVVTFLVDELDFTPVQHQLPVTGSRGFGELTTKELNIRWSKGWIDVPDKGLIDLAGSRIHIPRISDSGHPSDIHLEFSGGIDAVLELLDHEPFNFMKKVNISPDIATGPASGKAVITMPLKVPVKTEDIRVSVDGIIRNMVTYGLWRGEPITALVAHVTADEKQVSTSGEAFVGDILTNGTWHMDYRGTENSFTGELRLDRDFLDQAGLRLAPDVVRGSEWATFSIELGDGGNPRFRMTSNLKGLEINLPVPGWQKPAGEEVAFTITGRLDNPVEIDRIVLESAQLDLDGTIELNEDGQGISGVSFGRFRYADAYDGPVEVVFDTNGSIRTIAMTDELRLAGLGAGLSGLDAGNGSPVSIKVGRIEVADKITLVGVSGQLGLDEQYTGRLKADLNGSTPLDIGLVNRDQGIRLQVASGDAGSIARELGLTSRLAGGNIVLNINVNRGFDTYEGNFLATDTVAYDIPALAALFSTISLTGLVDQMGSGGISFFEVMGSFRIDSERLEIMDGHAQSTSIGLTAQGTYTFADRELDINGSLTPNTYVGLALNTLLPIGRLLGQREGEGLGTIRYSLTGPVDDPVIETNFLTLFSPIGSGEIDGQPTGN